jgi:hypothetical protein
MGVGQPVPLAQAPQSTSGSDLAVSE